MSDEETAAEAAEETPNEESSGQTEKKKPRRKPIWVCVPTQVAEVAVTDPETGDVRVERQPTHYDITRCTSKKQVMATLKHHQIDTTSIGDVLMFRADPLEFEAGVQLSIRY